MISELRGWGWEGSRGLLAGNLFERRELQSQGREPVSQREGRQWYNLSDIALWPRYVYLHTHMQMQKHKYNFVCYSMKVIQFIVFSLLIGTLVTSSQEIISTLMCFIYQPHTEYGVHLELLICVMATSNNTYYDPTWMIWIIYDILLVLNKNANLNNTVTLFQVLSHCHIH